MPKPPGYRVGVPRPFWTNVLVTESCWLYTGSINDSGYGLLSDRQRERTGERRAHRHAYVLYNGPIPTGLQINHHCDVRACVRPDHLYAGTAKDNMDDKSRRGRCNARKTTHCPYGHPRTESGGRLVCKTCKTEATRRCNRRQKAIPPEKWRKP